MLAIISFVVVVVTLIFLAPILLKLTLVPIDKFTTALNSSGDYSMNRSVKDINFIRTKFTSMFDYVIMAFFFFSIILLLITSFLVDVHPAFLIVYIIARFMLMLLAPATLTGLNYIYGREGSITQFSQGTDNVVQYIPLTAWVLDNFTIVILGVFVLSGIIMFGKYRLAGGSTSGAQY